MHMKCLLITLLALPCLFTVTAGESREAPDAFWSLPAPGWMVRSSGNPGVQIDSVMPGFPAHKAGLRAGDICLSIGSVSPADHFEGKFALDLAIAHLAGGVAYTRNGTQYDGVMPGLSAFGRAGLTFQTLPLPLPRELSAQEALAWRHLPRRTQVMVLEAPPPRTQPWLAELLEARRRCGTGVAVAASTMPTSYLQRVFDWFRLCATLDKPAPAVGDAEEALFRAVHLALPLEEPLSAGQSKTGSDAMDELIAMLSRGDPASEAMRQSVVERISKAPLPGVDANARSYVTSCLMAIAHPKDHGGWPYRHSDIWETEDRQRTLASIQASANAPVLAINLAKVCPAVLEGNADLLTESLLALHAGSPWLAREALGIACHAARFHNRRPWLFATLMSQPAPWLTPALRWRLSALAQGDLDPDLMLAEEHIAIRMSMTWRWFSQWMDQSRVKDELSENLNALLWAVATDPQALDPDACVELARQLAMTGYNGLSHPQIDTVAAAFARAGMFNNAILWQEYALRRLGDVALDEQQSKVTYAEFASRLALYRKQSSYTEGKPPQSEEASLPHRGGGTFRGRTVAGAKAGPWTLTGANGKILERIGMQAGVPCGRWEMHDQAGNLRWSGWVHKGARLGWWRIRLDDGAVASGWYDGREAGVRCGWWRVHGPDGVLRREGPCANGRPVCEWTSYGADGRAVLLKADEVVLPAEPEVPQADTTTEPAADGGF